MKLNELAVVSPTKQAAKVFESYFGQSIAVERLNSAQAGAMLKGVHRLIKEHRRTREFHSSEQNPAYLKLVVMEQALTARLMELDTAAATPGAAQPGQPNPQAMAMQQAQKRKEIDDQIKSLQSQIRDLQQQRNMPAMGMGESRMSRRLREASEIQQAQVVLASQDMVDQVQKMSEQVSSMQFKDLPALVDQIKNEVGVDQATQFNGDASAALSGLLQNLGGAKQQLEAALGVVTGQAPQVPGADMGAPASGEEDFDIAAEVPTPDGEEDIDAEMDANIEPSDTGLGRERR